jgi:hypothetical protein
MTRIFGLMPMHYELPELLSEHFEHGRRYGTVRVRNPFLSPDLG